VDHAYSALLGAAFLLLALAVGAHLVSRLSARKSHASHGTRLAWASLVLAFGSFSIHLAWGHRPGTSAAMPPLEFLSEHLSFLIILVVNLSVLAFDRWVGP